MNIHAMWMNVINAIMETYGEVHGRFFRLMIASRVPSLRLNDG